MEDLKVKITSLGLRQRLANSFREDPAIAKLEKKRDEYMMKKMFIQAMKTSEKINWLYEKKFEEYVKDAVEEARKVDLNKSGVPDDLKEKMNILYVTTFMACDIIESTVMDMNSAIRKYDENMCVEMFDDIKELSVKAKEKLKFFQETSGYLSTLVWGDKCDDIYEMMKNKAKKILKENKSK